MKTSRILAASASLMAVLAAGPAHAADIQVRIGLPLPPFVEVVPPRVYVTPPAYVSAPVYVAPAWRDRDRDGIPDWRDRYDNRRDWRHGPGWRVDRDRDGIPDWRDRHDNRRDGRGHWGGHDGWGSQDGWGGRHDGWGGRHDGWGGRDGRH